MINKKYSFYLQIHTYVQGVTGTWDTHRQTGQHRFPFSPVHTKQPPLTPKKRKRDNSFSYLFIFTDIKFCIC